MYTHDDKTNCNRLAIDDKTLAVENESQPQFPVNF